MWVNVMYFGVLKDHFKVSGEQVQLAPAATVGELLRILDQRTSNSTMDAKVWNSIAVAVNREYSPETTVLRDGDEVALLPPVSGGLNAR